MEKKVFPTQASAYDLLEEIGRGACAVVHRGLCKPLNEFVAIKCLDLDACNNNLTSVSAEAQVMSLVDHPKIIKAFCSFIVEHYLWVVMPYMDGGSCLHVMRVRYPEGLEEPMIAVILKETLKSLDYLHEQQRIHRDVKAGNILLDSSGAVKLSDFGTSACMFNGGDRLRCQKTITGTPCWMAPEVLEERCGYNCSADIWSFGITALELAHGHAPFSKYPPQKVLLMTMTSAPPCLNREKDKHFSKAFKDVIKLCLNKEPSKRPTSEKLLKHPFFKHTKSSPALVQRLLSGLGPLADREKALKDKDAALLASKKLAYSQEEEKSWNEYKRGVSCWNFDVEALKDQAASIHDEDEIKDESDAIFPTYSNKQGAGSYCGEESRQPLTLDTHQFRRSCDREPKQFGRFGVFDGDLELESPGWHVVRPSRSSEEAKLPMIIDDKGRNGSSEKERENCDISNSCLMQDIIDGNSSNRCPSDSNGDMSNGMEYLCLEKRNPNGACKENKNSCSFVPPKKFSSSNSDTSIKNPEEKNKETGQLVKGVSASILREIQLPQMPNGESCDPNLASLTASYLAPQLKKLLHQTAKHYEVLADLLRTASPTEARNVPIINGGALAAKEPKDFDLSSNCHRDVDNRIHELESQVATLSKELAGLKLRNMQLEYELNAVYNRRAEESIQREVAEREKLFVHLVA